MIILIKRYSRRKEPSMKCKHLKKTSSVLVLCLRVKQTTLYVEADGNENKINSKNTPGHCKIRLQQKKIKTLKTMIEKNGGCRKSIENIRRMKRIVHIRSLYMTFKEPLFEDWLA